MKIIFAIVRIARMNQTKEALSDAGLVSFTAAPVLGRGRGRGLGPTYRQLLDDPIKQELLSQLGPEPRLKPKRIITVVVSDDKKDLAVQTIIKTNQTGNSGDGKIFVVDVLDSVSVRTGERGDLTLD
jgi:nitrogen regulatory protein PII 2